MNLIKALKTKKKLIKQINEEYLRFQKYNSQEKHSAGYDPETSYNNWLRLTDDLIDLKTKIHKANFPIIDKIFRLGELKSIASNLRNINTMEGIQNVYKGNEYIKAEYEVFMNFLTKDIAISKIEEQIEILQEEIEAFNALTKI